jgi:Protein of unknown function (DUF3102)
MTTSTNKKRSLDVIGDDLRRLRNIFDSGKLLVEASEACEHGEWLPWLEIYFDASEDTARRHMAAYRLSLKYCTVQDLQVPSRIIYALASDLDDPDLPAIIEALDSFAKITVADAEEVIDLTRLRIEFGDYPLATLFALKIIPRDVEWAAAASAELKKAQPDSDATAGKIVLAYRRKRLEELFGGALPDRLGEMAFDWLENVEPEHRKQVLAKLNDASHPLDWRHIAYITPDAVASLFIGDEDQDDDEDPPTPDPTMDEQDDEVLSSPPDLDAEFVAALNVILHHARRPMPTSIGGIISGAELVEAARFLDKLHELATGGSSVKRIADAAEARSRSGRAANGQGPTDRWSES